MHASNDESYKKGNKKKKNEDIGRRKDYIHPTNRCVTWYST